MTDIVTRMAQAAREELDLLVSGGAGKFFVHRPGAGFTDGHLFNGQSPAECRAWIARRAMLAALRVLNEESPRDHSARYWLNAVLKEAERDV